MSRRSPFCHFPTCALAIRSDGRSLGRLLLDYSAVRTGLIQRDRWGKRLTDARFANWRERIGEGFDESQDHQEGLALCLALKDGTLVIPSAAAAVENFHFVDDWRGEFEKRFGKDAWVRTRSDFVKELTDLRFDAREFRVLCGIRRVVGRKKFSPVTKNQIRYGAAGFRSETVYRRYVENPLVPDVPTILSVGQVGRTREKLEPRGIFYSVKPGRRIRYYSFTVGSHDELRELVMKAKRPALDRIENQRRAEDLLRQELRGLNGSR